MKPDYIVIFYDKSGFAAHVYGCCAIHAAEDTWAKKAIGMAGVSCEVEKNRDGKTVVRKATARTTYPCERCEEDAKAAAKESTPWPW